MLRRNIWVGFAVLGLVAAGCGLLRERGDEAVDRARNDSPRILETQVASPPGTSEGNASATNNALTGLANNQFDWSCAHNRIDMPLLTQRQP